MRVEYPQYRTQIDTFPGLVLSSDFTDPYVWAKPTNAVLVQVTCIGPGGAGGGGRRGATGTLRGGGGGGSGGSFNTAIFPAALLPDTVDIAVVLGPPGGAGATADDTDGDGAFDTRDTKFGAYLLARAGKQGEVGTDVLQFQSTTSRGSMLLEGLGGINGEDADFSVVGCPGGGAGAPVLAGEATTVGGYGGASLTLGYDGLRTDSAMDGIDFALAGAGPGRGGGGGNSDGTVSLDGGDGGLYGAGGGGGAGSTNGTNAGNGGAGGAGICVVVTYF